MRKNCKQLVVLADKLPKSIRNKKIDFINELIPEIEGIELIYTGLLPGPELEVARLAKQKNIPYIAVIPFRDFPKKWPQKIKNDYNYLIKKSILTVYVDRQLGYISERTFPDLHCYEKIRHQIQWIFDKVNSLKDPTKVLFYNQTIRSLKRTMLDSSLYRTNNHLYLLDEKVFSFPHTIPFTDDDDLPF